MELVVDESEMKEKVKKFLKKRQKSKEKKKVRRYQIRRMKENEE